MEHFINRKNDEKILKILEKDHYNKRKFDI